MQLSLSPWLMAGTTDVVRPSSVAEPDDRLTPQSPIPMPVAGASGSAVLVGGDAVPAMPVIHLHRHEHAAGTVDEEARAVVDRLATQHGELFAYLHKEIEDLKKDALRQQFGKEVVAWADTARQEMGRLGLELRSLRSDVRNVMDMLRGESGKLREDVDRQLVQIRTLVHDNQRQLRQELQQLNSQATTMTKDWGNDITRLLGVCERNTQAGCSLCLH